MFAPANVAGEIEARQRLSAFAGYMTAFLGLLVLGVPVTAATIRATLISWALIVVITWQFIRGRLQTTRSLARRRRIVVKNRPIRRLLMTAFSMLTVTLAAARVGAAANTFKQSAELRNRTAKASEDVDKYVSHLDKTEQALASVSQAKGQDLRKRYESFSKQVNKLEDAQKHATSDIDEMKSRGASYFSSWDTSISQISDPELKQASTDRRSKVMQDHDELASSLSDIGSQLQPFMSNLHDLKRFLETDLSPSNVAKAGEMIQKSQTDAQALKVKIAGVQETLKQFLSEAPK